MSQSVLVVGASGVFGGAVARALLAHGMQVRALSRSPAKLAHLGSLGAEVVRGDVRDVESLRTACEGMGQVFNSANSLLGSGATTPARVDIPGMRNLTAAALATGVQRMVHTSALGITPDSPVDLFRAKCEVDGIVTTSGQPYVLLKPTAFMETWVNMLLDPALAGKPVPLFGGGRCLANFVAVGDVAEVASRIMADRSIINETVEIGGPSTMSTLQLADLIARVTGRRVRRLSIPVSVLRVGSVLLRPFAEVPARYMALGYVSATADQRMDRWEETARRFGVNPMTVEAFIAARLSSEKRGS